MMYIVKISSTLTILIIWIKMVKFYIGVNVKSKISLFFSLFYFFSF